MPHAETAGCRITRYRITRYRLARCHDGTR